MQSSLFCRFSFALAAAAVLFAAHAAQGETYYYVGGPEPSSFAAAANWATEDGTVCTSDPDATTEGNGNTFVFTNSETVAFHYTVRLNTHVVKRGSGMVVVYGGSSHLYLENSTLTLEEGRFAHGYQDQPYNSSGGLYIGEGFHLESSGSKSKTFYLYGQGKVSDVYTHRDVIIPNYSETDNALKKLTFYDYSSTGFKTSFKGPANSTTRFSANFSCNNHNSMVFTLAWNPGYPSATMEIVGRVFNRTDDKSRQYLEVASGTMRFGTDAGVTRLDGITVKSGATLEISDAVWSATFGSPLTIEEGGKLKISRRWFNPSGGVTANGAAIPDGEYTSSDYDWIEGVGILVVGSVTIPDEPATTAATWTGNGENTSVLNPANWGAADNETLPDLTTGSLEATFPVGTEATVPAGQTVAFKGISVSAPSFTLKGGVGSKVALGSSGVTVTGAAFTNECFTALKRNQTWDVSSGCTNVWAGEVAADFTVDTLTLTNKGFFVLLASNPDICNVQYFSHIIACADVPLGFRSVTATARVANRTVHCYGNVYSNNFTVLNNFNGSKHNSYAIIEIEGGTNVFCGKISSNGPNGNFWRFNTPTTPPNPLWAAIVKGGYSFSGDNVSSHFSTYRHGVMTVEDVPMDVTRMYVGFPFAYWMTLNLNVASNTTTRGIIVMQRSTLNTTVPYALYATDDGQSGVSLDNETTWNLSADQGVNVLAGISQTATVVSDNGATLHLRDDRLNTVKTNENQTYDVESGGKTFSASSSITTSKVQTNKVAFVGNVNFSKEGVLDHFMEGVSTSTGSISVKKGRMIFTTGSWQNASAVNVSDGGTLELRNGKPFGKDTQVAFTGENTDGMLVIPAGTTVKLRNVTVNGTELTGLISDGLVTGGGTLAAGKLGLSIIFR